MVIKCPQCSHYVSDTAATCPHCGFALKEDTISSASQQQEDVLAQQSESSENVVTPPIEQREEATPMAVEQPKETVPAVEQAVEPSSPPAQPVETTSIDEQNHETDPVDEQPTVSAPVAPQPLAYQQAKKSNATLWAIVAVLAIILCSVSGYLYYDNIYLPEKIDKEAPRYYTMANVVVLRSSRLSGADFNKLASLPYGTELITYEYDTEWAHVKIASPNGDDKKLEGYVAIPYIMEKHDFFLLNSIFGNPESREVISTTKCRIALLDYFKSNGYIGKLDSQIQAEVGIDTSSNSENQWQVFCKPSETKPNSVLYKRLYNRNSQFTDFAVIISNIVNGERKLLYFYFDDDETPHLLTEQAAPSDGYIKDATIKYNPKYNEPQLFVTYSN